MSTEDPSETPDEDVEEENGDSEDDTTTSARTRAWWLSTVGTLFIIVSYTVIYAATVVWDYTFPAGGSLFSPTGALVMAFLLSVVYIVGPAAVESMNKLRGGD